MSRALVSNIECELKWMVSRPYKNPEAEAAHDAMMAEIDSFMAKFKEFAKDEILAWIPVGRIRETERNVSDMYMFDDYEIIQQQKWIVKDHVGPAEDQEFYDEDDATEALTETAVDAARYIIEQPDKVDAKYRITLKRDDDGDIQAFIEEDDDSIFYVIDKDCVRHDEEGEELEGQPVTFALLSEELQDEVLDELAQYLKDNDFVEIEEDDEQDELYWNDVWQYDGNVNEELARSLGFCIVEFTSDNERFMGLQGCGMDLSPKIVAYQALEFGYIDSGYAGKFSTKSARKYTQYVMGTATYEKVMRKLGLTRWLEEDAKEEK